MCNTDGGIGKRERTSRQRTSVMCLVGEQLVTTTA
jgi:hypothetical protein